jgi:LPXTG-motif cell wall-anchored protein
MKKSFCLLVVLFLALAIKPVWAVEPMMKLVPSSGTYTKDTSFEVMVAVDSGAVETMAIDVHLKFDPSKVEIVSAEPVTNLLNTLGLISIGPTPDNTSGTFFDSFYINPEMHPDEKATVSGNLLNIKFKPKIVGTINVDFNCTTGSDADSNIFDGTTTADRINCLSNINGVYTITDGGTSDPNPTAVPTTAPSSNDPDPTAVPAQSNELPQTGTVETTIGLIIFGIVSVLSSLALKFL